MRVDKNLLGMKTVINGIEETIIMVDRNEKTKMRIAVTDSTVNSGYLPSESRFIETCDILDGVETLNWNWVETDIALNGLVK